MSKKMFDDLIAAAPLHHPQVADRVSGLISTIADRIMDTQGDMVKISDLATTLRFDPDEMAQEILAAPAEVAVVLDADGLRTNGPTIEQFVAAGYKVSAYPPTGYASKSTSAEIAAALDAETKAAGAKA